MTHHYSVETSLPTTEYVTFFDSAYLPQGLSLHNSIQLFDPQSRLTVYAMDNQVSKVLSELDLVGLDVLPAWDRLPNEIQVLRGRRDWLSLLWTTTPFVIADRLKNLSDGTRLYYVDADMALFRNPRPVFQEFEYSDRDILITAHNFAPEYDASHSVGEFAVQFLGVRRNGAEDILRDWGEQCLKACPTSPGDGVFGDQKYLDNWPARFPQRIHIASDPEWFQGPWNAVRFPASRALAYHFHGLRIMKGGRVRLTTHYRLPGPTISTLYVPYTKMLNRALESIQRLGLSAPVQASNLPALAQVRQFAGRLRRTWASSGGARYLPLEP